MQQHGVGGERVVDVAEDRQLLPFDDDRAGGGVGCFLRLGDDESEMVGLPPADVARHGAAAGVLDGDEHRLVEHREAVLVDRHVAAGEHGDDAGQCFGGTHVETGESGRAVGQ
ncbi:MAG: hypothetical protein R2697_15910 [Ilumatobacteraceae bacterium]